MKIEQLIKKYWVTAREAEITAFEYPDDRDEDQEELAEEMKRKILEHFGLPIEPRYENILAILHFTKKPLKQIATELVDKLETASKKRQKRKRSTKK